jgi:tRNA 2-selenouridine synthase
MAIQRITIDEFIQKATVLPVFDVRSPGEYKQAHFPGAYSLPLFTDEERAVVGTLYKQQGKQKAIKTGLDYFGGRMRSMVEQVEAVLKERNKQQPASHTEKPPIIVHCWRGGMRSAGVAWLLDLYGFQVYSLVGGYKAFRQWVLQRFELPYQCRILGGYTGSGKTAVLKALAQKGSTVIDLEALAHHKGSAFGALGEPEQPTQEQFENLLALQLHQNKANTCWLEDESQRIGKLNIPHPFWRTMRQAPVFFLKIPFEERLHHIVREYSGHEKERYVNAIIRIQKRLGPNETKTAIHFLLDDDYTACFRILLMYYDKTYDKGLQNRHTIPAQINVVHGNNTDVITNLENLLQCLEKNSASLPS